MKLARFLLASLAALALLGGCGKTTQSVNVATPELDTSPPSAPDGLTLGVEPVTTAQRLTWSPSAAPDLASYEVFVYSPDPDRDNSYVLLGQTEGPAASFALQPVGATTTNYYRVRAVDQTANRSAFSATLRAVLRPPVRIGDPGGPGGLPPGKIDP